MEIEQDWQSYRSTINENAAIFSVNLGLFEQFPAVNHICEIIVQFDVPYLSDDTGLPQLETYVDLQQNLLKISTLISAQPNVYYAGNILCNGNATLYFYCNDALDVTDVLDSSFPQATHIQKQFDPTWDLYFDFLIISPLEMKLNATTELLNTLKNSGKDLSNNYQIEHKFHFLNEQNLSSFLEYISTKAMPLGDIRLSSETISIHEEEEGYTVKLVQELSLDNSYIFQLVKEFDALAFQYEGDYIGWECLDVLIDKPQLN
ncbi:TIGR01619 family protein [Canicola haemoglobinophilus]|uniref:Uncharacterized protein conserved in bacteria n=1 Tax=Canicola haemoglobinophilus TaxID=733 RepID=A0A1V4AYX0_9PAST|nr:TIGR01619 family protein [Canicola haemoglobinophilus]OOR98011.1 TIGR01619 family protein [Canicola haemoglobinophilus]STO60550.1 Uncharacterized protein conserved in bacteria [Canicola haemoglobinophilus]